MRAIAILLLCAAATLACPYPTAVTTQGFARTGGGATDQLVFTGEPSSTPVGTTLPAVSVAAVDSTGSPDPSFSGAITVSLGTNPSGANLLGTRTVAASSGVATFTDLSIDKAGTGFTMVGSATGLTKVASGAFDVTSAAATRTEGQRP